MSALTRQIESPLVVADWQPDVAQMLDEHHLIATSDAAGRRLQFAASFGQFLGSLRDAEVCTLYGRFITDLESFCYQLERAIPGPTLDRRIDGPASIASLLRYRHSVPGRRAARFRYYLWNDADVLLKSDRKLFSAILDVMAGVAAEAEYVSDDLLLIHRAVLVGGSELQTYYADPAAQCRTWMKDEFGEPFWQVVTGIEQPSWNACAIDTLDRA